ncbi:MAG: flagellar biosynthesis protein FlhB [Kordiimonadaceae bacterium]|nr:flagellar biosynthesis protein FlhB [Kordiimonadaceae bacterium]
MAEEDDSQKTEEPTAKKLEDAQKKGEMATSQEIKTLVMLTAATAVIAAWGNYIVGSIRDILRGYMSRIHLVSADETGMMGILVNVIQQIAIIMSLPLSAFVVAALVANRMQNPSVLAWDKVTPAIKNLSLIKGAKKLFSSKMFVDFFKISGKLIAVAGTIFLIAYPERGRLDTVMTLPPIEIILLIKMLAIKLLIGVLIILVVIAAADYSYQQYSFHKRMKMSKQEVKDERKNADGDPQIKSKLRQIRLERHAQRMMANMPRADVVITNPTHYAVAIEYKHESMDVPILLAKGVDEVAARIREAAAEYDIPIVENPPLARALHASVDIDEEIPPDHYKAVAAVISYILKMRRAGVKIP